MALPRGRRIALDIGSVRVGVAATDLSGNFASPHQAVAPELINQTLASWLDEIAVIYIGMPKHLSGVEGSAASSVRDLAKSLKTSLQLPIRLVDERLTTKSAAERQLREPALRSYAVDSIAALEILEFALQGESNKGELFGEAL